MTKWVLQIVARVDYQTTGMEGKYVSKYDPTYHLPDGSYDGGVLEVSDDPAEAMRFDSPAEALAKWKQPAGCECHGVRTWDGKPNRPLTAFHCSVERIAV